MSLLRKANFQGELVNSSEDDAETSRTGYGCKTIIFSVMLTKNLKCPKLNLLMNYIQF